MSSSGFLISIIVPTHNRSRYAIDCIKSLLELHSDAVQVVVHDTSNDACELKEWVANNSDPRLVYVHWEERLSMTENHERALSLAEGEYICLIGDDDTVSRRIVDAAQYAKARNLKVLTPKVKASYYWPDFRTKFYGDAHAGKIYIEPFTGKVEKIDVHARLNFVLAEACQGTETLPKLYHGLIHRTLLHDLRDRNNVILFGTSPDMSAAISLSLGGGFFHVIDFPFTLPGGAGGSNSGRSAVGKHKGKLESDPHIAPFKNLNWPSVIPKFFSVETVWAHAAWETLRETADNEWQKKFNLARLYALCLFFHFDYRNATVAAWKSTRENGGEKVGLLRVGYELSIVIKRFVFAKLQRLLKPSSSNGRYVVATVGDVYQARQALDRYLDKVIKEGMSSSDLDFK